MGVSGATYTQHESGIRGFPATRAERYARFFRVNVEWLLFGRGGAGDQSPADRPPDGRHGLRTPPPLGLLPVRGTVQAGAWLEVDAHDQRDVEMVAGAKDHRFPLADQWLSVIRGDSMNDLKPSGIFDGDLVQCVDAISIEYQPRTGDVVEVERIRFQGRERELTLKQVELTAKGVVLWPRSTNPRWQQPLRILGEGDAGDDVEVRIRGWVIKLIRNL
jgi:SOS-response transcriptional repressor LexA